MSTGTISAFFYGTLLHPAILKRVLSNDGEHLQVAPGILMDFTRHRVKGCDYPAITPYDSAKTTLFEHELTPDERSVRGTIVSGLTEEDWKVLDIFEGDEYTRQSVSVYLLSSFTPFLDSVHAIISPEEELPELKDPFQVQTYVWGDQLDLLTPELWSFDVFVKEKLHRWVGSGSSSNRDYAIVDERRALNGSTKSSPSPESNSFPEFGRSLLSQFGFHKDFICLNNGSYGSVPRPVMQAAQAIGAECDARPDLFMRKTYYERLTVVRERLAHLVCAERDEIVLVPNATHGINTVLRNFEWSHEDVLVGGKSTTTYGAVSRTQQYIHDIAPHPALSVMTLTFPTTHAAIIEQFRAHLRTITRKPGQKVVAIIDSISSNPGCLLPWEKMVKICKEEKVWSVIDAAHSIGQELDINLKRADPDFWVSNCHKWLYSKRGCAVFYVPFRNQHIIKTTFPTSFGYVSPEDPKTPDSPKAPNFVTQFNWTGTIDVVIYLTVIPALEFRESLGGEKRINEYCHQLAVKGGKWISNRLQTSVMPEELTLNMTNILLPLPIPPNFPADKLKDMRTRMENKMLSEWDFYSPVFVHDNKWWTRCSAQVFNDLSDFDYAAKALEAICREFREELTL